MKKKLLLLVALFFSILLNAQYSGGTGTSEDPYLISTKADLMDLTFDSGNWDKYYKQTTDLIFMPSDFASTAYAPIGTEKASTFSGVYDGGNYEIRNLEMNFNNYNKSVGMFGHVREGIVKNVRLIGGALTYTNGYAAVGGIVGNLNGGTVINCYSSIEINSESTAGGVIGAIDGNIDNVVSKCAASGNISTSGSYNSTGGLIGIAYGGSTTATTTISDCYATGNVSGGNSGTSNRVGGLMGRNNAIIERCYASGNISGGDTFGRLIAAGSTRAVANDCFWIDLNDGISSVQGTGKTDAEMKMQSTFTNWDFDNVWQIDEGNAYPVFQLNNLSTQLVNKENTKLSLYPNPTNGILNLKSSKAVKSVDIYNLQGKLLKSLSVIDMLNISDLASGMYLLNAKFEDGSFVVNKIIKK